MRILTWKFVRAIYVALLVTAVTIFLLKKLNSQKFQTEAEVENNLRSGSECYCADEIFGFEEDYASLGINSTCSDIRSWYKTGQNVVSYTYHDDSSEMMDLYQRNILENLNQIREFYPGYLVRLYTDAQLEGKICEIVCENPEVHWCDINDTPFHGNLSEMHYKAWKFLPLGDSTVDVFLSRDLDDVVKGHRAAAVKDWLENTTKPIQVMRDDVTHRFPILPGLWGASNARLGEDLGPALQFEIIVQAFSDIFPERILKTVIWKWNYYKELIVAYDSYFCRSLGSETLWKPFNMQKDVDSGVACPLECRPPFGKFWSYC